MPSMTPDQLIEIINETKISHSWMLKALLAQQQALGNTNYSDGLKHSIATEELLREFTI